MSRATESNSVAASAILSVRSLSVDFRSGQSQAVKSLSFDVKPGKRLAIVGESGSGKSVTSRAIMRLTDFSRGRISGGEIIFQSRNGPVDLVTANPDRIRQIRGGEIASGPNMPVWCAVSCSPCAIGNSSSRRERSALDARGSFSCMSCRTSSARSSC